jgi:iron-sulfur cluster assembly protein
LQWRKKSFLYLAGTILEFSGGINGKGSFSTIQMQIERVGCGKFLSLITN